MGPGVGPLESVAVLKLFGQAYHGRRVLVTGHNGFKGSWLCLWLAGLGAEVTGYSLAPGAPQNHFRVLSLPTESTTGDILDQGALQRCLNDSQPEIVFHLAAQSLVRASYEDPLGTLSTNVMGVAHLLDACRRCSSVKAVIVVTSDKCYENKRQPRAYSEEDALGGHDPYSASKAAAEIVTASYRESFFPAGSYGDTHATLIASARAGNVIAGGDWAEARLIPDIVRAAIAGEPVSVRNPESIRPWQHVLDCLAGYLLLGQRLLAGDTTVAAAWNFGPDDGQAVSVLGIVERFKSVWAELEVSLVQHVDAPHEAAILRLDSSRSHELLEWRSVWNVDDAVSKTVEWYQLFHEQDVVSSSAQLNSYVDRATETGAVWARA